MKQTAILFGAIFLTVAAASAQANTDTTPPVAPEASAAIAPGEPSLFALATPPALAAANEPGATDPGASGSNSNDQQPPSVYGVFQNYNWQVNGGYTFFRFYVVPKVTENMNGLNLGMVYYPKGFWIGPEGQFDALFGNVLGLSSKYVMALAGPRFRWSAPLGLEVWGHGLVGGSNFLPQTAFGKQSSFTYEAGGGVDINVHQKRFAYRIGADMVGTRYFNTHQYSPRVAVSFVYKF
jgi:hypothetical protein